MTVRDGILRVVDRLMVSALCAGVSKEEAPGITEGKTSSNECTTLLGSTPIDLQALRPWVRMFLAIACLNRNALNSI
jgi:hypothetical protein